MPTQKVKRTGGSKPLRPQADTDTLNPLHDEIMTWADEHLSDVLVSAIGGTWDSEVIQELREEAASHVEQCLIRLQGQEAQEDKLQKFRSSLESWSGIGPVPKFPRYKVYETTWFYALYGIDPTKGRPKSMNSPRATFMGFADMLVRVGVPVLGLATSHIVSRYPLEYIKPILGPGDYAPPSFAIKFEQQQFLIDVRVEIPSISEVMMDIQWIRQYTETPIIVISADPRGGQQLRKQGVAFVHYDKSS